MTARLVVPPPILRLDVTGQPLSWVHWQDAVCMYVKGLVAWETGLSRFDIGGGLSRTGQRSSVTINSIIAVKGAAKHKHAHWSVPHLTNRELFRRDRHVCLYCGQTFGDRDLTRDHIQPRSRGGTDRWTNVVTACRRCNVQKGCRTPEESHMPLLAVPFVPNPAEYLALLNRKILADQMDFLKRQFHHKSLLDLV